MDTIVHLGAYPNPADFIDVLLQPNVAGLYHVCEAAAGAGVRRLVLASSVQVISGHRFDDRPVTAADGPAPTNHYALTKAWAELAGDMYARVHNLSVISVRIGWLPRNPEEGRRLAASPRGPDFFLSHDDSDRFHALCVESPKSAPRQRRHPARRQPPRRHRADGPGAGPPGDRLRPAGHLARGAAVRGARGPGGALSRRAAAQSSPVPFSHLSTSQRRSTTPSTVTSSTRRTVGAAPPGRRPRRWPSGC